MRDGLSARTSFSLSEATELHEPRPTQDGIERRAQFVAEGFEEFVLQPPAPLSFDSSGNSGA